jgi:DNA-binding XRE family transcriptional regulator
VSDRIRDHRRCRDFSLSWVNFNLEAPTLLLLASDSSYNRSVFSSSAARAATMPNPNFGLLLRRWRAVRRVSQLALALDADISTRHLSCVETGRAQPSREMVLRLADALQVPLRTLGRARIESSLRRKKRAT